MVVGRSSCDGFQSERIENRVELASEDAGGISVSELSNPQKCSEFCLAHGSGVGGETTCAVETGDAGRRVVVCAFNTMCEGRRPDGYEAPSDDESTPLLGRYFAMMAATEAASIAAFKSMAAELEAHGMPRQLARRARRAAIEEAHHHRLASDLARTFGGRPVRGHVRPQAKRTLLEMAIENAREGVVRETLGAALGLWQAQHASEPVVRGAMRRIAHDETSHAVLSWDVDACARERLSACERARLDDAIATALMNVEAAVQAPVSGELVDRAGIPTPRVARALVEAARRALYS
jgi:hypothetical protein